MDLNSIVGHAEQTLTGFASAEKKIYIQYQSEEQELGGILGRIKSDLADRGIADEDIKDVAVYIKPEEYAVFYVVNGDVKGRITF